MNVLKNILLILILCFIGIWYFMFSAISWCFPILSVLFVSVTSFAITVFVCVVLSILLFGTFTNNYVVTTDKDGNVSIGNNRIDIEGDGKVRVVGNCVIGNGNQINVKYDKD